MTALVYDMSDFSDEFKLAYTAEYVKLHKWWEDKFREELTLPEGVTWERSWIHLKRCLLDELTQGFNYTSRTMTRIGVGTKTVEAFRGYIRDNFIGVMEQELARVNLRAGLYAEDITTSALRLADLTPTTIDAVLHGADAKTYLDILPIGTGEQWEAIKKATIEHIADLVVAELETSIQQTIRLS